MNMTPPELSPYTALFEGLLEGVPLGIALLDTELRYVQINSRLAAMQGLPREAHLGKRFTEVIPPHPARDKAAECMRKVLRTGQPITGVELRYEDLHTPDRQVLSLASYYPLHHEGRLTGVYVFVEDITQQWSAERQREELLARERLARERAEAELQELAVREARYRAIIAALGEGIVVRDSKEILSANTSAERILGLLADTEGAHVDGPSVGNHPRGRLPLSGRGASGHGGAAHR